MPWLEILLSFAVFTLPDLRCQLVLDKACIHVQGQTEFLQLAARAGASRSCPSTEQDG